MASTGQLVSRLFAETYSFIAEGVLSGMSWPAFADLLATHRDGRERSHTAYVDVFPALVCQTVSGHAADSVPVAAAWTLYLLAGRTFDELQDNENVAMVEKIPLGLFAIGAAQTALSHITSVPARLEIITAFSYLLAMTAQGQGERPLTTSGSVSDYFAAVAARTGLVFATGAWAGGRTAIPELTNIQLDALYRYGLALGMMEQIVDDCTDIAADLHFGIHTLPLIYARSQTLHSLHPQLETLLQERRQTAVWADQLVALLREMGAINWSLKVAEAYQAQAFAALEPFDPDTVAPLRQYAARDYELAI